MCDNKIIVLDHYENIILDPQRPPLNNLHALNFMPQGLYALALTILKQEEKHAHGYQMKWFSKIPHIVPNAFHWFSISLVNYVRLVGLIHVMQQNKWTSVDLLDQQKKNVIKTYCNKYIEVVIPDVNTWRNKVSAHFAATDPYKDDNLGTLEDSVMLNVGVSDERFKTSTLSLVIGGKTSELPQWSVTETFELLINRYWPGTVLSSNPDNAIPPNYKPNTGT